MIQPAHDFGGTSVPMIMYCYCGFAVGVMARPSDDGWDYTFTDRSGHTVSVCPNEKCRSRWRSPMDLEYNEPAGAHVSAE